MLSENKRKTSLNLVVQSPLLFREREFVDHFVCMSALHFEIHGNNVVNHNIHKIVEGSLKNLHELALNSGMMDGSCLENVL